VTANLTFFDDDRPRAAFHAKVSRGQAAQSAATAPRRRLAFKRAAVVAAAIAVPALASPGSFSHGSFGWQSAPAQAAITQPMAFEIPGESFPGSAFYYLEDVPQALPDAAGFADASTTGEADLLSGDAAGPFDPGTPLPQAARPMRIIGSDSDHARAQRCMTQAIYYEAASESDAGQRAVAQVVLNRVAHPAWPNTVCGVVYQGSERTTGCQFSFTCDGSLARQPSAVFWTRASRIAREALAGAVYAPVGLATHYHTLAVHPYWADSLQQVTVIGAHQFYRWPGVAGAPGAFTMRHRGAEPMPGRAPSSPPAPDPLSPPMLPAGGDYTGVPVDNFAPLPASATAPAPAGTPSPARTPANNLPAAGSVRSEYANSGAWLERR